MGVFFCELCGLEKFAMILQYFFDLGVSEIRSNPGWSFWLFVVIEVGTSENI